jgi:predicted lipoprotein with Yx(FWY)xxD motif
MHVSTIVRLAAAGSFLTLTACGSGVSAGVASNTTGAASATPTPSPSAVRTGSVPGIGTVLIDSQGRTLYYFLAERGGRVACTGQCAAIWLPVPAPASPTTSDAGLPGNVGVVVRPDGRAQLTYATWPLYTFVNDTQAGEALGQGVHQFLAAAPTLTAATGATAATTPMATPTPRPTVAPTQRPTLRPTAAPTRPPTPRSTPCVIPQNGGGDGDSDNFGAPSDGDGCDR